MTTLTETITQELLDAAADPGGLDFVFQKYGQSKGPFYNALAQATAALSEQFTSLSGKCKELEREYTQRLQKIKQSEQELLHREELLLTNAEELTAVAEVVDKKKKLLDQAKALDGLGFGYDELSCLHNLLVQLASEHGAKPGEITALFFNQMSHYKTIASVEMEEKRATMAAKKAQAEAEYWQTQVKTAEAKAKSRKVAIDCADKLLSQGVKQDDLPHWSLILEKAGVPPENLVKGLGQFASLEKICQDRQQQKAKLEGQIKQLESQVNALNEEREKVTAAIGAVKETALAAVENTSQKTLEHLASLSEKIWKYEDLVRQASVLEAELALARALRSTDPGLWKGVRRQEIRDFLSGIIVWSQLDIKHNPLLPSPPQSISSSVYSYYDWRIHLKDALYWTLSGLFTEEERKVLAGSR